MDYLVSNKEWIFSGIGIMALGAMATFVRFLINHKGASGLTSVRQSQKSGHSSTNTQVGSVNLSPPASR
jgi:hypothetical protein